MDIYISYFYEHNYWERRTIVSVQSKVLTNHTHRCLWFKSNNKMKNYPLSKIKMTILAFAGALIVMAGCSKDPLVSPVNDPASEYGSYKLPELDEVETADLLYIVQEERLAYDMYSLLYLEYELAIFQKIAASEEKHVATLSELISKYELTNPNDGMDPGEYENEVLQSFYDEMLAQAMQSKAWAIQTGVTIEEVDIEDLLVFQARVDAKNLVQCYAHLEDASLKHLESFQDELK